MFVTLEGPEGAGKTTVLRAIAERLQQEHIETLVTREPGGSLLGTRLREALLEGGHVEPTAELFLFLADRAQHVAEVIRPALQAGQVVLCDRFTDSTIAYQGHGRGLDLELLRRLNEVATGGLQPDLTLLLDLDPALGLRRLRDRDRLDSEPLLFHQKVREGFLAEARREPERWRILNASQDVAEVTAHAVSSVLEGQTQHERISRRIHSR